MNGVDQACELLGVEDVGNKEMSPYGVGGGHGLAEPPDYPVVRRLEVPGPAIGDGFGPSAATLEVHVDDEPIAGDDRILRGVLVYLGRICAVRCRWPVSWPGHILTCLGQYLGWPPGPDR